MSINHSRRQFLVHSSIGLATTAGLLGVSTGASAAKPAIYTPRFSNLALSGYDPVHYFNANEAKKGAQILSLEHEGVEWRFVSKSNKAAFEAAPEKYAPQFGGYCAFSVAQGKLVKGDPKLWAIEGDKLYINYNKGIHKLWLSRKDKLISDADANWPTVLG